MDLHETCKCCIRRTFNALNYSEYKVKLVFRWRYSKFQRTTHRKGPLEKDLHKTSNRHPPFDIRWPRVNWYTSVWCFQDVFCGFKVLPIDIQRSLSYEFLRTIWDISSSFLGLGDNETSFMIIFQIPGLLQDLKWIHFWDF